MSLKRKIQVITDCVMTALLPFLMAYSLVGEALHEWLGTAMLVCLIVHHILNLHKPSIKNAFSRVNTILNVLMGFMLLALMESGIVMSGTVFRFLPIEGGRSIARQLHLPLAYWSYLLMSLHLGLHWNTILNAMRKVRSGQTSKVQSYLLRVLTVVISAYGAYAFVVRDFPDYLFLKNHFVFLDYNEPLLYFLADYLAILVLFAWIGYMILKLLQYRQKKEKEKTA